MVQESANLARGQAAITMEEARTSPGAQLHATLRQAEGQHVGRERSGTQFGIHTGPYCGKLVSTSDNAETPRPVPAAGVADLSPPRVRNITDTTHHDKQCFKHTVHEPTCPCQFSHAPHAGWTSTIAVPAPLCSLLRSNPLKPIAAAILAKAVQLSTGMKTPSCTTVKANPRPHRMQGHCQPASAGGAAGQPVHGGTQHPG
jgi:hypothetical protein